MAIMGTRKIVDYTVASGADELDLIAEATSMIAEGWQPFGGVAGDGDSQWLYQAMVKYE